MHTRVRVRDGTDWEIGICYIDAVCSVVAAAAVGQNCTARIRIAACEQQTTTTTSACATNPIYAIVYHGTACDRAYALAYRADGITLASIHSPKLPTIIRSECVYLSILSGCSDTILHS